MALKNKRETVFEETGGELYGKQENFTVTFAPIIAGNKLQDLSSTDWCTTWRIRGVLIESKFVDDIHDGKWETMIDFPEDNANDEQAYLLLL